MTTNYYELLVKGSVSGCPERGTASSISAELDCLDFLFSLSFSLLELSISSGKDRYKIRGWWVEIIPFTRGGGGDNAERVTPLERGNYSPEGRAACNRRRYTIHRRVSPRGVIVSRRFHPGVTMGEDRVDDNN